MTLLHALGPEQGEEGGAAAPKRKKTAAAAAAAAAGGGATRPDAKRAWAAIQAEDERVAAWREATVRLLQP